MLHIALYQPEIPPNTGNMIRLCANTGAQLHLIHPLGFAWDSAKLRRAGLDYHEWVQVKHYPSLQDFCHHAISSRLFALSTKGKRSYSEVAFQDNDTFLFGPAEEEDDIGDVVSVIGIAVPPSEVFIENYLYHFKRV